MGTAQTLLPARNLDDELRTPAPSGHGYTPAHAAVCLAVSFCRLSETPFDEEPAIPPFEGYKRFHDYVLGFEDGVPKTPNWAARVTGVPSYTIKALATTVHAEAYSVATESEMAEVILQAAAFRAGTFRSPATRYGGPRGDHVAGTVYDYEADQVIEGAQVTIKQKLHDGGTRAALSITTDDLGNFFADWPQGVPYSVHIEKDGYVSREWAPAEGGAGVTVHDFPLFFGSEGLIW